MSLQTVFIALNKRSRTIETWKEWFDRLKSLDTPESDIFFWAEELKDSGHLQEAKELVDEYLAYRKTHGRIGEYGIIGQSEAVAAVLGRNYVWDDA